MPKKKLKPNRPPHGRTVQGEARVARIIPLVAAGMPDAQIAAALGLTLRQVTRWKCADEVKATIDELKREAGVKVRLLLEASHGSAVSALLEVAGDPAADPTARVKAATAILDRSGVGVTKNLTHSGPNGKPIETVITHQGQPTSWRDVKERADALSARATAELAAIAEAEQAEHVAVIAAPAESGYELPAALDEEDDDGT